MFCCHELTFTHIFFDENGALLWKFYIQISSPQEYPIFCQFEYANNDTFYIHYVCIFTSLQIFVQMIILRFKLFCICGKLDALTLRLIKPINTI
jgi:hypothetical protein